LEEIANIGEVGSLGVVLGAEPLVREYGGEAPRSRKLFVA